MVQKMYVKKVPLSIKMIRIPYWGGNIFSMNRFPGPQIDELLGLTAHWLKAKVDELISSIAHRLKAEGKKSCQAVELFCARH